MATCTVTCTLFTLLRKLTLNWHTKAEIIQKYAPHTKWKHTDVFKHLYVQTYKTTINNQAPLSAGMQLYLLTNRWGSPPLLYTFSLVTLPIAKTLHTAEALFRRNCDGVTSPWAGSGSSFTSSKLECKHISSDLTPSYIWYWFTVPN